jgi:branched-chain amino acid aminotransferase
MLSFPSSRNYLIPCDPARDEQMPDILLWKIIISEKETIRLEKVPFNIQPDSLNTASRLLPKGVYTTMRTYTGRKILPIQEHLKRLEVSAALLGHHITLNPLPFYKSLQVAIQNYMPGDTRVRFTVDLDHCPGDLYLSIEPLRSPSTLDFTKGVVAMTCPVHRENPESKQTSFIEIAEEIRQKMTPGAHECLLLDDQGYILEGLSSNFFYVQRSKVCTAPQGILSGITRSRVIAAAAAEDIEITLEAAHLRSINLFEEAFITSSTRSVLPVRQIDNSVIGNPGPLTTRIQAAYWESIKNDLVDLYTYQ